MLLYKFLKLIIPLALRIFYREIRILGRKNLVSKGPLIIVCNHPNTLIDPLIVGMVMKQRIGILGKSTLFKNRIAAAILNYLHVIPIFRRHDEGLSEFTDNQSSFRKCYDYLGKNGSLLIFPEGTSYMDFNLRPVKTGAARIGLKIQELAGFPGDTQILPVTLNYSDPGRFRTRVTMIINEAIPLSEFTTDYQADPVKTVETVTNLIGAHLRSEMIIVEDKEQEALLKKVAAIYGDRLLAQLPKEGPEAEPDKRDRRAKFRVVQGIGRAINWAQEKQPERFGQTKKKVESYFDLLSRLKLKEGFISSRFLRWPPGFPAILHGLYLVLLFPVFLFGLITNYLPYILPAKIATKLTHEFEFWPSIMLGTGLFIFPLFYTAEILVFHHFLGHIPWATLSFGLLLPFSGLLALDYVVKWERFVALLRLWYYGGVKGSVYLHFQEKKQEIVGELEEIREAFLSRGESVEENPNEA